MSNVLFKFRNRERLFDGHPALMGILNVTPDSFSDGGKYLSPEAAIGHAMTMIAEGAEFINVGGESTRPGYQAIDPDSEIARVVPVIEKLRKITDIPISIDTSKAAVALAALKAGCDIVNDVTALDDPRMSDVIHEFHAGCILMHDRKLAPDDDATSVVRRYLFQRRELAVDSCGLSSEYFMLDPGIGFGKDLQQNLDLIANLDELRAGGSPVLLGMSRKSFIGKLVNEPIPEDRVPGTLACSLFTRHVCDVLRVHDVAQNHQALIIAEALDAHCHQ